MSWKARLASVKFLPPGHGIGYNFNYFTSREERIGVATVGYADGFRRRPGNCALVRGVRVPVVGGVCMDQCMLQLDEAPRGANRRRSRIDRPSGRSLHLGRRDRPRLGNDQL